MLIICMLRDVPHHYFNLIQLYEAYVWGVGVKQSNGQYHLNRKKLRFGNKKIDKKVDVLSVYAEVELRISLSKSSHYVVQIC